MDTKVPPSGSGPVETPQRTVPRHRVVMPAVETQTEQAEQKEDQAIQEQIAESETVWPMRLKLKHAIVITDVKTKQIVQQIDVLELREPTAADIIAVGVPVIVLDYVEGTTTFDGPKMAAMIARLSKTAPMYISLMDPIDFINVATMLQKNFLPDLARLV